ncbi:hypothetical protein MD484_g6190, partial [Candolleomyces efflorescens]
MPDMDKPNDLDAYVPKGAFAEVDQFLKLNTGYRLLYDAPRARDDPGYHGSGDSGVSFVRTYLDSDRNQTINVVETALLSPTATVFMFHSTIVMNFITWNSVVCAYPKTTLAKKGLKNTYRQRDSPKLLECYRKYEGRGFSLYDTAQFIDPEHLCGQSPYCGQTLRFVNDPSTLCFKYTDDVPGDPRADLIDKRIAWKLATKNNCKPEETKRPSSGFVHTGDGELLERSLVHWFSLGRDELLG